MPMGTYDPVEVGCTSSAMTMRQRDDDVNEKRFATLTEYAHGRISRGHAMEKLGLNWYGDLLGLLRSAGLCIQPPSPEDLAAIDASVAHVFRGAASGDLESQR